MKRGRRRSEIMVRRLSVRVSGWGAAAPTRNAASSPAVSYWRSSGGTGARRPADSASGRSVREREDFANGGICMFDAIREVSDGALSKSNAI
jgi:hypothetical protein